MSLRYIKIIICSILLFPGFLVAGGQGLPEIPQNPAITEGVLPDGVRYYLAPNNATKGYANFLLVQKGAYNKDLSRRLLLKLPHFTKEAPYKFLASKGVGYGPNGYISYPDGNTVFTFEDVPMFDSAACDSTMLLIFDLIQAYSGEQAIVICGDISKTEIEAKLHVFSLTVTHRDGQKQYAAYEWKPIEEPSFLHTENITSNLAEVSFIWTSPRTPAGRLRTTQPLVSNMYANVLGRIVEKRIRSLFVYEKLPLAYFSANYYDSSASSGDERYEFKVTTSRQCMERALEIMASIFANLDTYGASWEEFRNARHSLDTEYAKTASMPVENSTLARQCMSSFLYGTNIVDGEKVSKFFERRQLDPGKELSLFNNFAAALLDARKAFTLHCETPAGPLEEGPLMEMFYNSWYASAKRASDTGLYSKGLGDTLTLAEPHGKRVSLKAITSDPVTGGSIWTFANGVRVIFKKTTQKGMINYGLLLKGGYSYVPQIGPGESAFVGDMLGLYRIAGLSAFDFHNMLEANGIEMIGKASLTDVEIQGSAPSAKLDLLFKSLLSYSRDRQVDRDAFEYYKICQRLKQERTRLSRAGIINAIDSTMSPYYYYPDTKSLSKLGSDLPERVDTYLAKEFAKFNDGLLVIIGDVDELRLQKTLTKYLGSFHTSDDFSVRPKVDYELRPGWSTYTVSASLSSVGSGETCVNVGMATCKSFSIKSYSAFLIAATAMNNSITKALADEGMYSEMTFDAQVFPVERLAMFVTCRDCAEDGLPEGVLQGEPLDVLKALRMAINKVSHGTLTEKQLKGLKSTLQNSMSTMISRPDFLMSAVMMRNSECKDIVSNYKDAINAVTLNDVNAILHDLDFGTKVEYIIR